MKVKIMLGLLFVLETAFGATARSGSDPEPLCRPGVPCVEKKLFDGDPQMARQFSGEPIPPCKPGVNCPNLK